jgi:hypothetical protein
MQIMEILKTWLWLKLEDLLSIPIQLRPNINLIFNFSILSLCRWMCSDVLLKPV